MTAPPVRPSPAQARSAPPVRRYALLAVTLQLGVPSARAQAAGDLPTDAPRSAFAVRREVGLFGETPAGTAAPVPSERPGFAELPLPPELAGSGEPAYHDLRLVRSDGREVPYLLEIPAERHEVESVSGQLAAAVAPGTSSIWLVDLLQLRSFDALELQIEGTRFAKQVTVEAASERGGPFVTLRAGAGVFDRPWSGAPGWRVRHTSVEWDQVQTARYLRITVDNSRSRPIELREVSAIRHRATKAQMWTRAAPLTELAAPAKAGKKAAASTKSRYRLELPPGLPVEQLLVRADELALVRPVRLLELAKPTAAGATDERELASDTLYRLVATDPAAVPDKKHPVDESHIDAQLQAEWMTLRLSGAPGGGALVLEIDNGDSPPLSGLQVEVYGCGAHLIFEYPGQSPRAGATADGKSPGTLAAQRKWALYYGNPAARAPHYDLEALRERLTRLGRLHPAYLAAEQKNPRYQPAPPLQFVPTVGAPLLSERFRLQQALRVTGGQDIYAVTLDPVAVGLLRSDLGDVRIVDAQDRQVPYVLSADAGEARAELTGTPEPRPRLSRYRLTFSGAGDPRPLALPLLAVELLIRDTFYSRTVRLLASTPEGGEPRLLVSGTLQRHGEDAAGLHLLTLSGERLPELILEIDDQDNPALVIERISGVVRAPRLAFKLTPGDGYRLLLGDPDTEPPHYDIETLRQAVLDYAALPAQLAKLEPNRAYRARPSDYLLHAPPTALLWGSLLLAVAVLLGITLRLLGKTPPPDPENS